MPNSPKIIKRFQKYPALFTGSNTLRSIEGFFNGYWFATSEYGHSICGDRHDFFSLDNEFHSWVAYRLHYRSGNGGWCNAIYSATESEQEAISKFFELYQEFRDRTPHLVAKLNNFSQIYSQTISSAEIESYPDSISLVTYTDDPGFFVYCDEVNAQDYPGLRAFYPDFQLFASYTGATKEMLTIIDSNWQV